eukprot:2288326-Pyramimonas_sp.AAC.1
MAPRSPRVGLRQAVDGSADLESAIIDATRKSRQRNKMKTAPDSNLSWRTISKQSRWGQTGSSSQIAPTAG